MKILFAFTFCLSLLAQGTPPYDPANLNNTVRVSKNCLQSTNCFGVRADVQYVGDASWSNGGYVVTSATANFQPSDVGKIEFGTTACGSSNGYVNCYTYLPLGVINSYISSTQVTVSVPATAASSGSQSWFAWGTQDDAYAYQAALYQLESQSNRGGELDLACGASFIASAPFVVSVPHLTPITVKGCGNGTVLIPLPGFNQSSCGAYGNSTTLTGCIFSDWETARSVNSSVFVQSAYVNDYVTDISVWGLGQDNTGNPQRWTSIAGNNLYLRNVSIIGWQWNVANGGVYNNCTYDVSSSYLDNDISSFSAACGVAVEGDSVTATPTVIKGGGYGPNVHGSGLVTIGTQGIGGVSNGMHLSTFGSQFVCYGFCNVAGSIVGALQVYGAGINQQWRSYGDLIDDTTINGGTAWLTGIQPFQSVNQLSSGSTASVYLRDNIFTALGTVNATTYDLGGNTWGSAATAAPRWHGSLSSAGVPTASNIALSSGWGASATVSSVSGNQEQIQFTITASATPAANPTITYTFPNSIGFVVAPLCSAAQVGGTGANLTPISTGTPTTTGSGAFTVTGTPSASSTYIYQITCTVPF